MDFNFFKKLRKEEDSNKDIVLPVQDTALKIEDDLQFLIDYFYGITRQIAIIEHNAVATEDNLNNIDKNIIFITKIAKELNKKSPDFSAYWNGLSTICNNCVNDLRKILPSSTYALPLTHQKIESAVKISKNSSSEFINLLNDAKKNLNKFYKKQFKNSWPKRIALQ